VSDLDRLEALLATIAKADAWGCYGDDMRCADGNGCECEMAGRGRPDAEGESTDFIRYHGPTLIAELRRLREGERDAARYRWLRQRYARVNFAPKLHGGIDMIFETPAMGISANLDKTIDDAMLAGDGGA